MKFIIIWKLHVLFLFWLPNNLSPTPITKIYERTKAKECSTRHTKSIFFLLHSFNSTAFDSCYNYVNRKINLINFNCFLFKRIFFCGLQCSTLNVFHYTLSVHKRLDSSWKHKNWKIRNSKIFFFHHKIWFLIKKRKRKNGDWWFLVTFLRDSVP